jgi:hypothetical protein
VRGLFLGMGEQNNEVKPAPGKRMDFIRSECRKRRCIIRSAIHPSRNPPTNSFEEACFLGGQKSALHLRCVGFVDRTQAQIVFADPRTVFDLRGPNVSFPEFLRALALQVRLQQVAAVCLRGPPRKVFLAAHRDCGSLSPQSKKPVFSANVPRLTSRYVYRRGEVCGKTVSLGDKCWSTPEVLRQPGLARV